MRNPKLRTITLTFLAAAFLMLAGCGGGTLGTGIRTLRNDDLKKQPLFQWPKFGSSSCDTKVGRHDISTTVTSELGPADTLAYSAQACSFIISKQAESITVWTKTSRPSAPVDATIAEAWCVDARQVPGSERTLVLGSDRFKLPRLRWHDARYFRVTIKTEDSQTLTVNLIDDRAQACAAITPRDDE